MEINEVFKEVGKRELAYRIYRAALKSGEIVKSDTCSSCGVHTIIDGHHEDYDKPLEVVWLCKRGHGILHRERYISRPLNIENDEADNLAALSEYQQKW